MSILTFKVSNAVAETMNRLSKKISVSRNKFLTRALTSVLLQEELKHRKLTASLIKKGLHKNESKSKGLIEKSPFISTWVQIAPTPL